jgi:hypothetical protein
MFFCQKFFLPIYQVLKKKSMQYITPIANVMKKIKKMFVYWNQFATNPHVPNDVQEATLVWLQQIHLLRFACVNITCRFLAQTKVMESQLAHLEFEKAQRLAETAWQNIQQEKMVEVIKYCFSLFAATHLLYETCLLHKEMYLVETPDIKSLLDQEMDAVQKMLGNREDRLDGPTCVCLVVDAINKIEPKIETLPSLEHVLNMHLDLQTLFDSCSW